MPLTSSITQNILRADGSRRITEIHVDDLGNKYPVDYTASPGDDTAALMTQHGKSILANLSSIELNDIRKQVIAGVDIRTITQKHSRLSELKAILVEYESEALREKDRATLEYARIDAAKTEIG